VGAVKSQHGFPRDEGAHPYFPDYHILAGYTVPAARCLECQKDENIAGPQKTGLIRFPRSISAHSLLTSQVHNMTGYWRQNNRHLTIHGSHHMP
jgi:hypothetical protein